MSNTSGCVHPPPPPSSLHRCRVVLSRGAALHRCPAWRYTSRNSNFIVIFINWVARVNAPAGPARRITAFCNIKVQRRSTCPPASPLPPSLPIHIRVYTHTPMPRTVSFCWSYCFYTRHLSSLDLVGWSFRFGRRIMKYYSRRWMERSESQFSFDGRRDGFSARSIRRIWVSGTCARIELYLLIDVYSCFQVISVRLFRIIISITFWITILPITGWEKKARKIFRQSPSLPSKI